MANYLVTISNGQIAQVTDENCRTAVVEHKTSKGLRKLRIGDTDGWSVELYYGYPGRISIAHAADGSIDYTKTMPLANGTIRLCEEFGLMASWKERCLANTMLQEEFGIRRCVREDPNTTFEGYHLVMDGDEHFEALCVVTDGETAYSCRDDYTGESYVTNSLEDEELHFYSGEMKCTVSDAKWAVVIKEKYDEMKGESSRSILLYTLHRNPFLLALELEDFLSASEYDSFAGFVEPLKNFDD